MKSLWDLSRRQIISFISGYLVNLSASLLANLFVTRGAAIGALVATFIIIPHHAMASDVVFPERRSLPENIARVLRLDPQVAEANARVCQAIHRLGIGRAEARPQVTAKVTGGRQLSSRIKRSSPLPSRYLSPEQQEINTSGAHHRDFDHRQKNNIYDGTVSLRVNLYDWGESKANIAARDISYNIARFDAKHTLAERGYELLNLSLRLQLLERVMANHVDTTAKVKVHVERVQARLDAGVGRVAELREARLLELDLEIEGNRYTAQRDLIIDQLATEFSLGPDDARVIVEIFMDNRPLDLAHINADGTEKAHVLRLRQNVVTQEEVQIRSSRYPKFTGVLDGTLFDITDHEEEYELVGRIEMAMPLYDGGSAKAQLRETAWRTRELKSALDSLTRDHNSRMEGLSRRFNDIEREEQELGARKVELEERLNAITAVQGKTVTSPQQLAQLEVELGRATARLIEVKFERESVRANALVLTEQLDDVLVISNGEAGC